MDKEEFRVKLEEINHLVEIKDYEGAMKVVDSIDWRRVKNVRTLCVVGEIYAANKRYEDSREIFLLAYHRAPIGKNILYRLIEVSLKMGDISEAQEYYQEFLEVAPDDNTQYVLNYKILTANNAPVEDRIHVLEQYKDKEFTEKWSYELAKLYFQSNQMDKCLSVCNEMNLWFSEGAYVSRAMQLKDKIEGAAPSKETAENDKPEAVPIEPEETEIQKIGSISMKNEKDLAGVESIQEKISKGLRDIFGKKDGADEEEEDTEKTGSDKADTAKAGAAVMAAAGAAAAGSVVAEEVYAAADDESDEARDDSQDKDREAESGNSYYREEDPTEDFYSGTDVKTGSGKNPDSNKKDDDAEDFYAEDFYTDDHSGKKGPSDEKSLTEKNLPDQDSGEKNEEQLGDTSQFPEIKRAGNRKNTGTDEDFNLEDSILAAATVQGISIPDEDILDEEPESADKGPESAGKKPESADKTPESAGKAPEKAGEELEDEEFLSEEDLAMAEQEFMGGPSGVREEAKKEVKKVLARAADPAEKKAGKEETDLFEDFEEEEPVPAGKPGKKVPAINPVEDEAYLQAMEEPLDIIPRERRLNEEEVRLFTYFVKVPGMKEQLIDTLCDVQDGASDKTSRTGNIIVMGGRETGKTRLISALIPAICSELNLEATKVAYVFAQDINGKDIANIVNKLSGGFLVIEDANQLTLDTVNQLNKAMEFRTDGMILILEDEKIGMRKMMARYPKFAGKFTSLINIPVFTNDELVNFAGIYALENGYKIDQMGMLALYNQIGENQKEDQPMNIGAVKVMMDAAIEKAEKGFLKLNRKKRVDKDGFVVLHEKDFS